MKNDELVAGIMRDYRDEPDRTREDAEQNVRDNLRVTVVVTGGSGEQIVTHDVSGLDESNLPSVVTSIVLDTAWLGKLAMGRDPVDRSHILLDFGRPPLVDLSNASGEPTENASNFTVVAANATWGVAVHELLRTALAGRMLARAWLHGTHTYDLILLVVGFPAVLWGTWRIWTGLKSYTGVGDAGYAIVGVTYIFLVLLVLFRALFGIARWVWPYLELRREGQGGAAQFWRAVIGAISLGVLGSLVYDVLKVVGQGHSSSP